MATKQIVIIGEKDRLDLSHTGSKLLVRARDNAYFVIKSPGGKHLMTFINDEQLLELKALAGDESAILQTSAGLDDVRCLIPTL